jgi:hypothetical protein
MASLPALVGLAGCSEPSRTLGRGEMVDSFKEDGEKISAESYNIFSQSGSQFMEMEYSLNIQKPDSGFEVSGPVHILIMKENSYRDVEGGYIWELVNNPDNYNIEGLSRFDVDGQIEESGLLPAGIYHVIIYNQGSRPVEVDIDVDTYSYKRDINESSCGEYSSVLDIKTLTVNKSSNLIRNIFTRFHIVVNDTSGDEYTLNLNLQTDRDEANISMSQDPGICSTKFVGIKLLDDFRVNPGFFDTDELIKASVSIEKDGDGFAERKLSFIAIPRY